MRRYYAGMGATDTAAVACESQCLFAARDIVGDSTNWQKRYDAGMWPAGCETQASCIQTVQKQCMEQNCCKLHKQLVDDRCSLAQMLFLESTDLCQEAMAASRTAGCIPPASATSALQTFQADKTRGDATGAGGKTGLTKTASSTPGSCASMIPAVQAAIGVNPDGQWGKQSQAALAARGGDFRAFAPGCTGDVPWYSATGKKAPASATAVTTQVAPNAALPVAMLKASSQGQIPWNKVAMGVVAVGIVAALYYAVTK